MKGLLMVLFLLTVSTRIWSQDTLLEKDITLNSVLIDKRESLPIVNHAKQEIMLFLLDNAEIKGLRFSMNYELTNDYTAEKPNDKYNILLGHSASNDQYHLFFTNAKKSEFYVKSISVTGKRSSGEIIPLKFKDERLLETISYKNKFYILSVIKRTSKLKIYVFEENGIARTELLDFSEYKFSSTGYTKLFDVLVSENSLPMRFDLKIHKIDNSNPNPLDLTSKAHKLYYFNDKVYLTLDNNVENTKIITISLDDFSSSVKFVNQTNIDCKDPYWIRSNSYLFSDKIYQIKGCKEALSFRIVTMDNDSIIKEFRVKDDEEITLKNSALIQEGGTSAYARGSEKELSKTKQVLRKVSASDIGITAQLSGDNLELTIGGFKEVKSNSYGGGMTTSSGPKVARPIGSINASVTYHYNLIMYGYYTYTNTRSVYFKTLLDSVELNHVTGGVSENVFDKMRDYEAKNEEGMTCETIFKVDDYYVFGYYQKLNKRYYLVRFDN